MDVANLPPSSLPTPSFPCSPTVVHPPPYEYSSAGNPKDSSEGRGRRLFCLSALAHQTHGLLCCMYDYIVPITFYREAQPTEEPQPERTLFSKTRSYSVLAVVVVVVP